MDALDLTRMTALSILVSNSLKQKAKGDSAVLARVIHGANLYIKCKPVEISFSMTFLGGLL